ncbi:uncharacterized protein LOC128953501 [Oppia nitens]|uniref:uncharacterized protein LOC128953501 n=1 Tax=Oppia nitens TaxID=1686743 RepID=UPI0023DA751E|nr:uncharacterized protein LOC128953501 [Oppia nitens]
MQSIIVILLSVTICFISHQLVDSNDLNNDNDFGHQLSHNYIHSSCPVITAKSTDNDSPKRYPRSWQWIIDGHHNLATTCLPLIYRRQSMDCYVTRKQLSVSTLSADTVDRRQRPDTSGNYRRSTSTITTPSESSTKSAVSRRRRPPSPRHRPRRQQTMTTKAVGKCATTTDIYSQFITFILIFSILFILTIGIDLCGLPSSGGRRHRRLLLIDDRHVL